MVGTYGGWWGGWRVVGRPFGPLGSFGSGPGPMGPLRDDPGLLETHTSPWSDSDLVYFTGDEVLLRVVPAGGIPWCVRYDSDGTRDTLRRYFGGIISIMLLDVSSERIRVPPHCGLVLQARRCCGNPDYPRMRTMSTLHVCVLWPPTRAWRAC